MNLNINQLTEQLWTGGDLAADIDQACDQLAGWLDAGITHIIDCRAEFTDQKFVASLAPEVIYHSCPVDDMGRKQPDKWFDDVTTHARQSMAYGGNVLVHCHMGINRGPSAAYAVLLDQGWDPIEAMDLIRAQRPIAAVDYAEDALDWYARKQHYAKLREKYHFHRLAQWRKHHPHETRRIVREIQLDELIAEVGDRHSLMKALAEYGLTLDDLF